MTEPKVVAGLSCIEVLEKLSDYLEPGGLDGSERAQIEEHLAGCSWCEQFGGSFAGLVSGVKAKLREAPSVPPSVLDRLNERLDEEG